MVRGVNVGFARCHNIKDMRERCFLNAAVICFSSFRFCFQFLFCANALVCVGYGEATPKIGRKSILSWLKIISFKHKQLSNVQTDHLHHFK